MLTIALMLISIYTIVLPPGTYLNDTYTSVETAGEPEESIIPETRAANNNWYTTTVDNFQSCGQFSSIDIDSQDSPHIAYWESQDDVIKWAFWNGTHWDHVLVDSGENVEGYTAIAIDHRNDEPHFSYRCTNKIKHAYYGGTPIQMQYDDVDTGDVGRYSSIVVDGSSKAHISYLDSTDSDLNYAKTKRPAPGWDIEVPYPGPSHGEYTDICLDANEYPHISYYNRSQGSLQYAHKVTPSEWQRDTVHDVGDVGQWTSIALNGNVPVISYYDVSNGDLRFADNSGGAWSKEQVDGAQGQMGEYSSIAVNSQGVIGISYYDADNGALKYAYHNGQFWRHDVVDSIGNVGLYTSLAFDGGDQPHISYYDLNNEDLKYATIDNEKPNIDDQSNQSTSTGELFYFKVNASDNREVGEVHAYWTHGDDSGNKTLHREGDIWVGIIHLREDKSPLKYNVSVCDVAGNWREAVLRTVDVIDNKVPALRNNHSPDQGTTGDNITFTIEAYDNIGVTGVEIGWSQDGASDIFHLRQGRNITTWSGEFPLRHDSTETLMYTVKIRDGTGNPFTSQEFNVTVSDDDPPGMEGDHTQGDPETGNNFDIEARFQDNVDFREVFLKWGFDGAMNEGPTQMSGRQDDLWGLTISIPENARSLDYFFNAWDNSDNENDLGHKYMDVIDVIEPTASAGDDQTIMKGQTVFFNADQSSDNIDLNNFTWRIFYDNENIELYGMYPDFTFEFPGTYDVELTVKDSYNNPAVDHVSIEVLEAYFDFQVKFNGNHINDGDSHEAEAGSEVEFHGGDSTCTFPDRNIAQFHWFSGDEDSGDNEIDRGDAVFHHTFNTPGTYPIRLTLTDSEGGTGSITFDVVVLGQEDNEAPQAIIYIGDTHIGQDHVEGITVGSKLTLDGSRSGDNVGVVSWKWTFHRHEGETSEHDGNNVVFDFGEVARYTVTLTVWDEAGNEHSTSFDVDVSKSDDEPPVARFQIDGGGMNDGDQKEVEVGTELTFHAGQSSDNTGIDVYEWTISFEDQHQNFEGDQLQHRFDGLGDYTVTLRVADLTGNEDFMSVTIKVSDRPVGKSIGPIRDLHGDIVIGARVTLKMNSQEYEAFTDDQGYAIFDNLEGDIPGGTQIFVEKDGMQMEWNHGEGIPALGSQGDDGDDEGMPPEVIIALLVLIIIIVIVIIIVRKRKKTKSTEERLAELEKGRSTEERIAKLEKATRAKEPKARSDTEGPKAAAPSPKRPEKKPKKGPKKGKTKEKKKEEEPRRAAAKPAAVVVEDDEEEYVGDDDDELPLPPPPEDLKEHLGTLNLEAVAGHMKNIIPGYIITDKLGAGGFATVYKAINKDGVGVAIKMPKFLDETIDSSVLNKFKAESDIWKKLKHKNIVTFLDSDIRPVPYMTIELMEGGNLGDLLKDHRLSIQEAKPLMLGILDGLSYAHRMASVHRDIKPENILFTKDGIPKIGDWGIGKFMASESVSQSIGTKGTFLYSAPEQFDKDTYGQVDWSTDIFQIGVVFYEMLTGINPFKADELAAVMGRILTINPPPPSSSNPDIPPEIDEIVMKCLEKQKEDRWRSTDVLYSKLRDVEKRKQANLKKYRKSLSRALSDGKISSDEEAMLSELREHMNITDAEHEGLYGEIMG